VRPPSIARTTARWSKPVTRATTARPRETQTRRATAHASVPTGLQ
jgi:hypothetical protein